MRTEDQNPQHSGRGVVKRQDLEPATLDVELTQLKCRAFRCDSPKVFCLNGQQTFSLYL
jgi:hypothetical protein